MAKASSVAAESVAAGLGMLDGSARRKRLMEWRATLVKRSIPLEAFESRPVTRDPRAGQRISGHLAKEAANIGHL